ncbi:tocopherol cyclase family protein [Clostridium sp. E02]|uniref:tocopherol cyclase family protein n=1 Tax=Clostridium sp. E02 TaxID=2487134 RepID=UPI000F53DA93|nr:tocopherol cyclase family protein [Clostridium sp. E02]
MPDTKWNPRNTGQITLREIDHIRKEVKIKSAVVRDSMRELCMSHLICQKKYQYFEGWYFKQQTAHVVLGLIPGVSVDKSGTNHPFLQIIWNENSYVLDYSEEDYLVDRRQKKIMLGNSSFSPRGIKLDIQTEKLTVQGVIRFGPLTPIRYSIMGPFQLIPFMECKHEILSMFHMLSGFVKINGTILDFKDGTGYIEGDKGRSFPRNYLWIQCNRFTKRTSIMVSVAHIPMFHIGFLGCICAIVYQEREYRFATYLGAKVVSQRETGVIIKQRNYTLKVFLSNQKRNNTASFSHQLLAPERGEMERLIKEAHMVRGRFLLYHMETLIFDLTSDQVSFESFSSPG